MIRFFGDRLVSPCRRRILLLCNCLQLSLVSLTSAATSSEQINIRDKRQEHDPRKMSLGPRPSHRLPPPAQTGPYALQRGSTPAIAASPSAVANMATSGGWWDRAGCFKRPDMGHDLLIGSLGPGKTALRTAPSKTRRQTNNTRLIAISANEIHLKLACHTSPRVAVV